MTAGQRKGTQWQRDVNTWLAARGWTTSRRSIGESGDDITAARGPHRLSVEVKNRRDISPAEFLDQAIGNAGPGQTPVVIIKRRGRADPGEAYALLRVADFNALLEGGTGMDTDEVLAELAVDDGRSLRGTALRCAVALVTGLARRSEEGATFNDRDDVLAYADDFLSWLTGGGEES